MTNERAQGRLAVRGPEALDVADVIDLFRRVDHKPVRCGALRWSLLTASHFLPGESLSFADDMAEYELGTRQLRRVGDVWDRKIVEAARFLNLRSEGVPAYSTIPLAGPTVIFLAIASIVGLVFSLDTFLGETLGARTRGLAFGVVCVLCFAGAARVATRSVHRYALAFLGTVAGTIEALALLLGAAFGSGAPRWIPLAAFCGAACGAGLTAGLWRTVKHHLSGLPRTLKVAVGVVGAGAVISLAQFVYEKAAPDHAGPSPDISAVLSRGTVLGGGGRVANLDLDVTNSGDEKLYVLASHFDVMGLETTPPRALVSSTSKRADAATAGRDDPLGRAVQVTRRTTLRAGSWLDIGAWFDPGSRDVQHVTVAVPREFDTVVAKAYLIVSRKRLDWSASSDASTAREILHSYDVYQDSVWTLMTHGTYHLIVIEATEGAPLAECQDYAPVTAYLAKQALDGAAPPPCDFTSYQLGQYYGLMSGSTTAELRIKR